MTSSMDVLIIEDDVIMRDAMTEWLIAERYSVRTAPDGCAGLAALKAAQPALVVTDIYMPGTSGATVISEMKRQHFNIPIIAISGRFNSAHSMDIGKVLALGATLALSKPIKRRDFLEAVATLLARPTP
jgi:CheY-like chemotaxis protein